MYSYYIKDYYNNCTNYKTFTSPTQKITTAKNIYVLLQNFYNFSQKTGPFDEKYHHTLLYSIYRIRPVSDKCGFLFGLDAQN